MNAKSQKTVSPLVGGLAGTLLQRVVMGKLMRRGGGGIKGMLLGAAATYLMNKFMTRRPVPARR